MVIRRMAGSIYRRLPGSIRRAVSTAAHRLSEPRYQALEEDRSFEVDSAKIARFRNIYSGKRCFIIGNGPSLNRTDLTKLDIDVPSSPEWGFSAVVPATGSAYAIATRSGSGPFATKTIRANLDTGAICGEDAVWGQTLGAAC